jgi:hypothetical protein
MWIYIQAIIVSIIIILILHYMFYYIRDTLTIKKTKDLVEIQTKKYKSIVEELSKNIGEVSEIRSIGGEPIRSCVSEGPELFVPDTSSSASSSSSYEEMKYNLQKFAEQLLSEEQSVGVSTGASTI